MHLFGEALLLPSKHFSSLSLRTARRSDRTPSQSPSRLFKRSFVTGTLVGSTPPPSCSNPALPSPSRLCCGGGISLPAPRSSFVLSLLRLTSSTTNDPRVLFFSDASREKVPLNISLLTFSISPLVLRGPDSNRPRGPARRVLPSTTRFLHESADSTFFFLACRPVTKASSTSRQPEPLNRALRLNSPLLPRSHPTRHIPPRSRTIGNVTTLPVRRGGCNLSGHRRGEPHVLDPSDRDEPALLIAVSVIAWKGPFRRLGLRTYPLCHHLILAPPSCQNGKRHLLLRASRKGPHHFPTEPATHVELGSSIRKG